MTLPSPNANSGDPQVVCSAIAAALYPQWACRRGEGIKNFTAAGQRKSRLGPVAQKAFGGSALTRPQAGCPRGSNGLLGQGAPTWIAYAGERSLCVVVFAFSVAKCVHLYYGVDRMRR